MQATLVASAPGQKQNSYNVTSLQLPIKISSDNSLVGARICSSEDGQKLKRKITVVCDGIIIPPKLRPIYHSKSKMYVRRGTVVQNLMPL